MVIMMFQEQRRLIRLCLRRAVFSCLVYNLTGFFSVYFTLSLWLSPHLFLLYSPNNRAVQLRLSLAEEVEEKKRGGGQGSCSTSTRLARPTRTNKQHCLFRSRAQSGCWEPFHVFHQLSHLLSDTPSASVSHSLSLRSICKSERSDETVPVWKKTAGMKSSQPPNVPLPAWWRGDLTGADRQTAALKIDLKCTPHARLCEWLMCDCLCADFTSNI